MPKIKNIRFLIFFIILVFSTQVFAKDKVRKAIVATAIASPFVITTSTFVHESMHALVVKHNSLNLYDFKPYPNRLGGTFHFAITSFSDPGSEKTFTQILVAPYILDIATISMSNVIMKYLTTDRQKLTLLLCTLPAFFDLAANINLAFSPYNDFHKIAENLNIDYGHFMLWGNVFLVGSLFSICYNFYQEPRKLKVDILYTGSYVMVRF